MLAEALKIALFRDREEKKDCAEQKGLPSKFRKSKAHTRDIEPSKLSISTSTFHPLDCNRRKIPKSFAISYTISQSIILPFALWSIEFVLPNRSSILRGGATQKGESTSRMKAKRNSMLASIIM